MPFCPSWEWDQEEAYEFENSYEPPFEKFLRETFHMAVKNPCWRNYRPVLSMSFMSINHREVGRIITSGEVCGTQYYIVSCRNPYGTHNLVVVIKDGTGDFCAFRHGNFASLWFLFNWDIKRIKRLMPYLMKRGWLFQDCGVKEPALKRLHI